jgi:hypothetical protein
MSTSAEPPAEPPVGLLEPARRGDAAAVRVLADWFEEHERPDDATNCRVLADEIALNASLGHHIASILRSRPNPGASGRATLRTVRNLLLNQGCLSELILTLIQPREGRVSAEGGRRVSRTGFMLSVPRTHIGGFTDTEGGEAFYVADALLEFLAAAFPRARFEVREEFFAFSPLSVRACSLIDLDWE